MLILGIILFFAAPNLLQKRLNAKEKERGQRGVIGLSALMFLGGFIVKNGDIEYNYSFESIITVEKEAIRQAAAEILF